MIKFLMDEFDKQFISVEINDNTNTADLLEHILRAYPILINKIRGFDEDEIVINLLPHGEHYDFSLNDLQRTVSSFCNAVVDTFYFDVFEDTGTIERCYPDFNN